MLSAGRSMLVPTDAPCQTTNIGAGTARLLVATFSLPQIPNGGAGPVTWKQFSNGEGKLAERPTHYERIEDAE